MHKDFRSLFVYIDFYLFLMIEEKASWNSLQVNANRLTLKTRRHFDLYLLLFYFQDISSGSLDQDALTYEYQPGSSVTCALTQAGTPPVQGTFDVKYDGRILRGR